MRVETVLLPASLLTPCPVPPMPPEDAGDAAFIAWTIDLVSTIDDCNARIAAIRRINDDRIAADNTRETQR